MMHSTARTRRGSRSAMRRKIILGLVLLGLAAWLLLVTFGEVAFW